MEEIPAQTEQKFRKVWTIFVKQGLKEVLGAASSAKYSMLVPVVKLNF